ncbi:MAG: hypothetical protein M3Z31_13590 [Pseudomonadota bacterium]|nr:hypothetical protein [Pseudomonadota bacterium]
MTQSNDDDSPGGKAPVSPEDALQFLQRMWNPFGLPMPGFPTAANAAASPAAAMGVGLPNPATMFMTLDPAEIERKIGELRVIENWLQMSLNFMQMSIKTMELQKASLEALRSPSSGAAKTPEGDSTSARNKGSRK